MLNNVVFPPANHLGINHTTCNRITEGQKRFLLRKVTFYRPFFENRLLIPVNHSLAAALISNRCSVFRMSTTSPFKSPNKRRSRSFKGLKISPEKIPQFPAQIRVIVSELRLFQQAKSVILSVKCEIGIEDQLRTVESSEPEFKDSNHSFNFTFNSNENSFLFKINQDWKRIVAKLDIETTTSMSLSAGASNLHAFGVSNVPLMESLRKSPNKQELLSIPVMNGHHKIGELKLIVAAYVDVSYLCCSEHILLANYSSLVLASAICVSSHCLSFLFLIVFHLTDRRSGCIVTRRRHALHSFTQEKHQHQ